MKNILKDSGIIALMTAFVLSFLQPFGIEQMTGKQERAIRDMYRNGRLSDIAYQVEGPNNKTSISYSDYKVYCQRNKEWAKRLKPLLTEGGIFITLNAVYLGGEKGLLEQLRAAGYRVRPANRGTKLKN